MIVDGSVRLDQVALFSAHGVELRAWLPLGLLRLKDLFVVHGLVFLLDEATGGRIVFAEVAVGQIVQLRVEVLVALLTFLAQFLAYLVKLAPKLTRMSFELFNWDIAFTKIGRLDHVLHNDGLLLLLLTGVGLVQKDVGLVGVLVAAFGGAGRDDGSRGGVGESGGLGALGGTRLPSGLLGAPDAFAAGLRGLQVPRFELRFGALHFLD